MQLHTYQYTEGPTNKTKFFFWLVHKFMQNYLPKKITNLKNNINFNSHLFLHKPFDTLFPLDKHEQFKYS